MSEIYKASKSPFAELSFVSTGLPALDKICGGGIPLKRVSVISGPPAQGKSTIALMAIAEAQKAGYKTVWLDSEYSADLSYMKRCGIDLDELDLIQPEHADEGLDLLEDYLRKNKRVVAVIDSIGGLLPRQEQEKSSSEKTIGAQAGLVSKFIRKTVPLLAVNDSALICITHEFTDIMSGKIKVSGGQKMEYHASLHFRLKPKFGVVLKVGDKHVGKIVVAQIKKTKLGPNENQEADLQFLYESGFNTAADIIENAKEKLFEKRGQFYYWGDEKIARGENGLREAFKDEAFAEKVKAALT